MKAWMAGTSPAMTGHELHLELGGLDPLPEIRPGGFLQVGREHGLKLAEGHEIILIVVAGEPLGKSLVGDVILTPGAAAAQAVDRKAVHGADDVVGRRPAP